MNTPEEKASPKVDEKSDWGMITVPAPMKCNYCGNDAAFFIQREWGMCADCFRKVFDFFFLDWEFRHFFSIRHKEEKIAEARQRTHKCRYFQQEFCSLYDSECNLRIGVKFCEGFEE